MANEDFPVGRFFFYLIHNWGSMPELLNIMQRYTAVIKFPVEAFNWMLVYHWLFPLGIFNNILLPVFPWLAWDRYCKGKVSCPIAQEISILQPCGIGQEQFPLSMLDQCHSTRVKSNSILYPSLLNSMAFFGRLPQVKTFLNGILFFFL